MAKTNRRNEAKREAAGAPVANTELEKVATRTILSLEKAIGHSTKLFKHGITKISIAIKVSGVEFSLDVEGPASEAGTGADAVFLADQNLQADLVFTITKRIGKKARGSLQWPAKGLSSPAVSGDSAHDAINVGTWSGIAFQERPNDKPYCDSKNNCWFSVFKDAFGRTDMGIHPDGGTPDATAGCIGLSDPDTKSWHDALLAANGRITCEVKEALADRLPDDGIKEA